MRERLLLQIESFEDLPTLPEIITEIMDIIQTEDFSIKDLKQVIEKDPALTAKLLKIANTFYYNPYGSEITSTERAIMQLGTKNLLPVVFGLSLTHIFTLKGNNFNVKVFWIHAYTCAHIAKRISKYFSLPEPEAFTAGLLHDVGKIVLFKIIPREYIKAIYLTEKENIPLYKAERELFGLDHSEAGFMLLNRWRIPDIIKKPVKYHHEPEKAENYKELSALINIANIFARTSGQYFGKDTYGIDLEEAPGWKILRERAKIKNTEDILMPITDDVEEAIEFATIAWG